MKITFPFTLLFLFFFLVAFVSKSDKKKFTPPGTVPVNDSLYFDETEVSNIHWREYEFWVKENYGEASSEYKNAFPDSSVWREKNSYCEPYMLSYYRHPAYNYHPVVGITFEQAAEYCKWRTARVRQKIELDEIGKEILPLSINYRLPNKTEWEEVAKADYSEEKKKQLSKKKWQGVTLYNAIRYDSTYTGDKTNPKAEITAPVYSYMPNKYGIYNLFGNVGEMISVEGIYKGGSWADRMDELKAERDYSYDKPTATVGFRCICEVRW